MNISYEFLIIMFSPVVVVLLFQLSSYLNQTWLSTGMKMIEIEDFADITGFPEDRIRMFPMRNEKVKFKVLDEQRKGEIGSVIFDQESAKISEKINIEIAEEKLNQFRKIMFSRLTQVPVEKIRISQDGDTFTEIETGPEGQEIIVGSVTFDINNYGNPPREISGNFKKLF
jgi:hypothetical protein